MFALDTNVVSEIVRPSPDAAVKGWLSAVSPSHLYFPAVVVAELLAGIELMPEGRRRAQLQQLIGEFIAGAGPNNIIEFGQAAAAHYARVVASRQRQGRSVKVIDAQIAASAAARGFPVVTRNVRDFDGCGVDIINPWLA